jgi:phage terminase small subunit
MTKADVIRILREHNPAAAAQTVEMYAALFLEYLEAASNIEKNGTIVAHPRTAAPIENPYYKIRSTTMRELKTFPKLRTDALWLAAKAL